MFNKIKQMFSGKQEGSSGNYHNKTILIVDDNDVDRVLVERTLKKIGCKVLLATNGEIGYELACVRKPDLILSDCNMPELNGIDMCKKIRKNPSTENIPIIFLTGNDSPSMVINAFELDAHNFMCKPINAKLLSDQIRKILDEHLGD